MVTIIILKNYINVSAITLKFMYKVVSLTLVSWLPLHMAKVIMNKVDPPEQVKIMGTTNQINLDRSERSDSYHKL